MDFKIRMKVAKLGNETDPLVALFALGKSYNQTKGMSFDEFRREYDLQKRLRTSAVALADKANGSEKKHLRFIQANYDIRASRSWWQQFVTYRAGCRDLPGDMDTYYSDSTMHSIYKRPLTQEDFIVDIDQRSIDVVNEKIAAKAPIEEVKAHLPEGFLQERACSFSYASIQTMVADRCEHKLNEWHFFLSSVLWQLNNPYLLGHKVTIYMRRFEGDFSRLSFKD